MREGRGGSGNALARAGEGSRADKDDWDALEMSTMYHTARGADCVCVADRADANLATKLRYPVTYPVRTNGVVGPVVYLQGGRVHLHLGKAPSLSAFLFRPDDMQAGFTVRLLNCMFTCTCT